MLPPEKTVLVTTAISITGVRSLLDVLADSKNLNIQVQLTLKTLQHSGAAASMKVMQATQLLEPVNLSLLMQRKQREGAGTLMRCLYHR